MLERCRFCRLQQLSDRRNALVLGDGDGRFLAQLMSQSSQLRAEAVDASAAMLQLLRDRVVTNSAGDRLNAHQADIRSYSPSGEYDLVATHFFLDCLTTEEVAALARQIRPRLLPGALWIVSDFAIPRGIAGIPSRLIVASLYAAFGFLTELRVQTLPEHRDAFHAVGLKLIDRKEWLGGLLFSELWELEATALITAISQ